MKLNAKGKSLWGLTTLCKKTQNKRKLVVGRGKKPNKKIVSNIFSLLQQIDLIKTGKKKKIWGG